MPRGKYARRRQARIERETGSITTVRPRQRKVIDPDVTLGEIPHGRTMTTLKKVHHEQIKIAIAEAQRLKRSKRKGCSNLNRNMEALGYRRVSGDEMVPEQFEAIA